MAWGYGKGAGLMMLGQGIANAGLQFGQGISEYQRRKAEEPLRVQQSKLADLGIKKAESDIAENNRKAVQDEEAANHKKELLASLERIVNDPIGREILIEAERLGKEQEQKEAPPTTPPGGFGTLGPDQTPEPPPGKAIGKMSILQQIEKEAPELLIAPDYQDFIKALREKENKAASAGEERIRTQEGHDFDMKKLEKEQELINKRAVEDRASREKIAGMNNEGRQNENGIPKTPAGLKVRPLGEGQENSLVMIASAADGIRQIERAMAPINELKYGPIKGRMFGKNPYDKEIRILDNLVNQIVPGMARGIFKEVGVLTDADMKHYKSLLPQVKEDPKIAKAILEEIKAKVNSGYIMTIGTLSRSGRDASGFEYENVWDYVDSFGKGKKAGSTPKTERSGWFDSEDEARAAGYKNGDKVKIRGLGEGILE